ncbi:MAG: plastocyanin/azurin family copper-binding protein [Opitutaceae bacterium]
MIDKLDLNLFACLALRSPQCRSLALGATLALGAFVLIGSPPLQAQGETGKGLIEHFDEHLEDFETEVQVLSAHVDAIAIAFSKGEDVTASLDELIQEWEQVEMHEVIETKAIQLYPPIWQGIYAMKQAAEKSALPSAMARAGERTKGALWQGLGGLRVLATLPGKGALAASDDQTRLAHEVHGGHVATGGVQTNNEIRLTGDDNMRFNQTHFVVRVGEPVTLHFENLGTLPKDVMGHNVVVLDPSSAIEPFGLAAAESSENDFIPTADEYTQNIVANTALLGPGEADEITFTLEQTGAYPFICSFTAHFRLMRGTIVAVVDPETQPIEAILQQLGFAVKAYAGGDAKRAEDLVHSAYLNLFEGLEGDLIEKDPELVTQLELDFNAGLSALFQEGAAMEDVRLKLGTMRKQLQRAKTLLTEAAAERSSVF